MFKYTKRSDNGEACSGNIEICCMGLLETIATGRYTINGIAHEYPSIDDLDSGYRLNFCPVCGASLIPKDEKDKRWKAWLSDNSTDSEGRGWLKT